MRFVGMEPWPEDFGQVEVVHDGELIDLHNCACFAGAELAVVGEEALRLTFHFVADAEYGKHIPAEVHLSFERVSDLTVAPAEDGDLLSWVDVTDWDYYLGDDGVGRFAFEVGRVRFSFRSDEVTLSVG